MKTFTMHNRRDKAIAAMLAASLVMLLVGGLGFWRAHAATDVPARANHALSDAAGTAEVQSALTRSFGRILSYDYNDPNKTKTAAASALTGDARKQYDQLFTALQKRAPGQKLTLSASVSAVAVKILTKSSATALVFLDQTSKRASDHQSSASAAQLMVDVRLVDGTWRISELRPL